MDCELLDFAELEDCTELLEDFALLDDLALELEDLTELLDFAELELLAVVPLNVRTNSNFCPSMVISSVAVA